ncbi:hypothetical protein [Aquimarina macrocephali]|uniref:hypothetical protein n=1 Tax=Aquimarina macrocephali TaxID=666563 RepID=UPI000463588D|nr:hypothetical protein [Aquimarina macrocephali]
MKSVKSFIKALGKNYYLDFIIEPHSEDIDFNRNFVLVEYQNKQYYEKNIELIEIHQNEIINKIGKMYENALAQIYLKLSTTDSKNLDGFIKFNIKAANIQLRTIKSDFDINDKRSRYCSTLIDNEEIQQLSLINSRKIDINDYPEDSSMSSIIESLISSEKYQNKEIARSMYYLDFHITRFKILSSLPFSLFHIANRFVNDLMHIQNIIEELNDSKQLAVKIKWLGKKTHIGYIFSNLAQEGYIDAPKSRNGETNYTAFAKLIKELFDVNVSEGTLRKYLNPSDDKFDENKKTFEKQKYFLPNVKLVN